MHLRKARFEDLEAIVGLYRSAIGRPGCVWNENYPTREDALGDLETGNLYVLDLDSEVIGAVSVLTENELDELDVWQVSDAYREIVRVVVSSTHQGKGYAAWMLNALFTQLAREGCRSIHLLAAMENPPAVSTYKKLGFAFLGECFMFDHDYYICEKTLNQ